MLFFIRLALVIVSGHSSKTLTKTQTKQNKVCFVQTLQLEWWSFSLKTQTSYFWFFCVALAVWNLPWRPGWPQIYKDLPAYAFQVSKLFFFFSFLPFQKKKKEKRKEKNFALLWITNYSWKNTKKRFYFFLFCFVFEIWFLCAVLAVLELTL